jgi:hypothetical protein
VNSIRCPHFPANLLVLRSLLFLIPDAFSSSLILRMITSMSSSWYNGSK